MGIAYFVLSSRELSRFRLHGRSGLPISYAGCHRVKRRTNGTKVQMATIVIRIAGLGSANPELPRSRSSILEATPWGTHLCEASSSIRCHSGTGLNLRLPSIDTLICAPSSLRAGAPWSSIHQHGYPNYPSTHLTQYPSASSCSMKSMGVIH